MVSPSSPLLPPSLEDILLHIARLSDEQFTRLQNEIQSEEGFNTDSSRCAKLATLLNQPAAEVGYVLSALAYLYRRVNSEAVNQTAIGPAIERFVSSFRRLELTPDEKSQLVTRLVYATQKNEGIEHAIKLQRLRKGFLKNAVGFKSFVDLRPDFDAQHEAITGLIPLIQIQVVTDSDDPHESNLTFQLSERTLQGLKEMIADVEKKLAVVAPWLEVRGQEKDSENK